MGLAGLVALGAWALLRPPSPEPLVFPPPEAERLPLVVVLYAEAPGVPPVDDLAARRAYLAEQVLPALVAAGPRAVVLDFHFVGGADDVALRRSLDDAREAGVPVLAARPVGRSSEVKVCGREPSPGCVLDLLQVGVPTGEVRAWPLCIDEQMTLGHAVARLFAGPPTSGWRRDFWCLPEPVPLQPPPGDPCAAPWRRLWVSELVTGETFTGPDPVSHQGDASCGATAADLADQVVIVGDPRLSASGRDVVEVGGGEGGPVRVLPGAEAHAVAAWSFSGVLLPTHEP